MSGYGIDVSQMSAADCIFEDIKFEPVVGTVFAVSDFSDNTFEDCTFPEPEPEPGSAD